MVLKVYCAWIDEDKPFLSDNVIVKSGILQSENNKVLN